jgi:hypothetical protein
MSPFLQRFLTKRGQSWVVAFSSGYWAFRSRSSFSLRFSTIEESDMADTVLVRGAAESDEIPGSAVSWAAVFAGAVAAAALSLALIALGGGLGLLSISPWSSNNMSVVTFGILAAAWLIAVQLFACGVGGYLAGRLRGQWVGVHTDEVFFRDTAHGLLVWAVCAVISATVLTSAASSIVSGVARTGATVAQTAGAAASGPASEVARQATGGDATNYYADMLFRSDHPANAGDPAVQQRETARILARSALSGDMPAADKTYVAQLVASRTGLSQADAEKRVSDVAEQAKNAKVQAEDAAKKAADAARKTGVYVALWVFISLLIGAFSACYMATIGGRLRDDLPMMD